MLNNVAPTKTTWAILPLPNINVLRCIMYTNVLLGFSLQTTSNSVYYFYYKLKLILHCYLVYNQQVLTKQNCSGNSVCISNYNTKDNLVLWGGKRTPLTFCLHTNVETTIMDVYEFTWNRSTTNITKRINNHIE